MTPDPRKTMTPAQLEYERKRAGKAGMTLEKWLESKRRLAEAEEKSRQKAAAAQADALVEKKPGLFQRMLDRAHKPL